MPDHDHSPIAEYLRQLDILLADLPRERRAGIRRELLGHLDDAAAEQGADPSDPSFQALVIDQLGACATVAAEFGALYGGVYRTMQRMAYVGGFFGGSLGMFAVLLAGPIFHNSTLALIAAGGLGIVGTILRNQRPRAGWLLIFMSGLLFAMGGSLVLHGPLAHSFDLLAGGMLLLSGELLLVNAAVHPALARLPPAGKAVLLLIGALLVSFVPPFSYLPNPLGAYYLVRGGYRYDPRLPLVNRFATLGADPAPLVAGRLERLIGQTGLDPLDPNAPLVSYELQGVTTTVGGSMAVVEAELHYADGTARRYSIPVTQYGWSPRVELTGVDRLLAEHRPLAGLIPTRSDTSIQLGAAARLPLDEAARRMFSADEWLANYTGDNLQWSRDGHSFLIARGPALWRIPIGGAAPQLLANDVASYTRSDDDQFVAFVRPILPVIAPRPRYTITIADLASGEQHDVAETDRAAVASRAGAAYFLHGGALWRAPFGGGAAERLGQLPDADPLFESPAPLAISPDGRQAAYRCGSDLCVADVTGRNLTRVALGYEPPSQPAGPQAGATPGPQPTALPAELSPPYLWSLSLAWSPDGQRLVAASAATDERGRPELRIITRAGQVELRRQLGPDGPLGDPQWTPDNRFVVLNAYPAGGRRIVAIEIATGKAYDLSKPGWDAFASLVPDGRTLLLWNGRGGFWTALLLIKPA